MATDKLHIDKIKTYFKNHKNFETAQIVAFYKKFEKDVKRATVNWRIYTLVHKGIIKRIGRGLFSVGEGKTYLPKISPKLKKIYKKLKKEFPYLDTCIWNTSALNEFMTQSPERVYILIEVEKKATLSVFSFLKESKDSVFLEPTKEELDKYLPENKKGIIVKSMVSEAPLMSKEELYTSSIEKMLVDIFCDDIIFSAYQGTEMRAIFKEALSKYSINQSRMMRYANRRGKKKSFKNYLEMYT